MSRKDSTADVLKKQAKEHRKKEKFIKLRMWISVIASSIFNDRGSIPPNIGNNIMITNNVYITKNSINGLILVCEFSNTTPMCWTSDLLNRVKDRVPDVQIDFTFKCKRVFYDLHDSGLQGRIRQWTATLNNPMSSQRNVERAARLLNSVDIISEGVKTYHTRIYITVRAKTGTALSRAMLEVESYLDSIGALYKTIKSNMTQHLEYATIISDKTNKAMKDVPYTLQTNETLAESMPVTQGLNDADGSLLGINTNNFTPYFVNFKASSNAKNIYVGGRSGFGKTYLVQNWLIDFYALKYGLLVMDVKGTEFTALTQAVGGTILSLRFDSPLYVNTYVWNAEAVKDNNYRGYADRMLNLTREQLMIMCNFQSTDDKSVGETLLDSFLQALYINRGVLVDNPNTWSKTNNLNPFVAYEFLERYVSFELRNKYGRVAQRVIDRLRMFMTKDGSCSHMFLRPIQYENILNSTALTFDFGLIEENSNPDAVAFKLKFLFMRILSDEYCAHRKKNGLWTVEVMEESQIVDDEIMEMYTKSMTLGRAQNKINIMLGNSISALAKNKLAAASLENFNIFVLGVLNNSSIEYVTREFALKEEDEETLHRICVDPEYEYTFLLVNRMQKNATTALLKAFVPERVSKGKLFRVVDVEE